MFRISAWPVLGAVTLMGFSGTVFAAGNPPLNYGQHSPSVKTLQTDLNLMGFASGPVDGIFGPKTQAGVEQFQKAEGQPVSGRVNTITWKQIDAQVTTPAQGVTKARTASGQIIDGRPVIAVYHMTATAYGPSAKDNYPYGATDYYGQPLQSGMIAVDPSIIPLKSTVYVTGYDDINLPSSGFLGHAMDTGGAIQGDRIDIFMNDGPQIVSNFGMQPVTVYVLGK